MIGTLTKLAPYIKRELPLYLLGIGLLILTDALALLIPKLIQKTIDLLPTASNLSQITPYALAIITIAILLGMSRAGSRIFIFNPSRNIEYTIRSDFLAFLFSKPLSFFEKHATGDLMSRATNDIGQVRAMLGPGILNIVNSLTFFLLSLVLMASIHIKLTLLTLLPFPLLLFLAKKSFKKIFIRSCHIQDELGKLSSRAQNRLRGISILKIFHQEEGEVASFTKESENLLEAQLSLSRISAFFFPLFSIAGSLGTLIVLWAGGTFLLKNEMTLGEFVAFNSYLGLLAGPALSLGWILNIFQRGRAAFIRLIPYLETDKIKEHLEHKAGSSHQPKIRGDIRFDAVSFCYEKGKEHSIFGLSDISFAIQPGSTLGITGPTGSGKSTLIRLIPRLYEITDGKILLDGKDIRQIEKGILRKAIGFVPQESFLFSRSIESNILFGSNEHFDSRNGAMDAAHAAEISAFTKDLPRLPQKLYTPVGEYGVSLSGGQRSRVAIARALLGEHSLYIMDDPLANVDSETEREILENLKKHLAGKTLLFVAHRLSALSSFDQILVIEEGRITQRGTHAELLKEKEGFYVRTLCLQQLEAKLARA